MKKYFLTLLILTLVLFSPGIVKADDNLLCNYDSYNKYLEVNSNDFDNVVSSLLDIYNNNYSKNYPYFYIAFSDNKEVLGLYYSNSLSPSSSNYFYFDNNISYKLNYDSNGNILSYDLLNSSGMPSVYFKYSDNSCSLYLPFYSNFDVNFEWDDSYNVNEFYFQSSINSSDYTSITKDSNYVFSRGYYYLLDFKFNSIENSSNYITVDLSKYHYVLLNLKDYSKKEAFSTNLQVKGMIGITPIYNYGTTAKDDVIGNKVEDRCNLSYKDYTNYRLSILKSDLENKAIYAVKGCEDNSSFKFDNTLFDITYVTDDNIDDPIVTIDGKEYHTIPYNQLPSTATQNEEENYIPGESKELSFSEIVDNVTDTLSSVWSSIITFMNLFTKFFNTLPVEIRVISITTFTTACTLGIIKILKS